MSTLTALFGFSLLATMALANELVAGPTYIGDRSNNPEQETYAAVAPYSSSKTLAFIGPARNVGPVTSELEKDTVAYIPLFVDPEEMQASLSTTTKCGVQ